MKRKNNQDSRRRIEEGTIDETQKEKRKIRKKDELA